MYGPAGNLLKTTYANGTTSLYTYDKRDKVISVLGKDASGSLIGSAASFYDPAGLLVKVVHENGDYITYTYDAANQLTSEIKKNAGNVVLYSYAYTYDAAKNRLSMVQNGVTTNYSYNTLNQLTQAVTSGVTTSYVYDNNGNTIRSSSPAGTTAYSYDYENRLNRITYPDASTSAFAYDGDGRKVKAIEGANVIGYLYDGKLVIIERNSSNQTQVTYTEALGYAGGIGGLISQARAGATVWYHYIHNGTANVSHLTNSSASCIQRYEFEAFGNLTYSSGSAVNNYRFQTKELNLKSGLVYFGARWYNPLTGRWLTPDPLGIADGPNLYIYCSNNPLNLIDPWGLCRRPRADYGN